jgi:hypothetical protein
MEAVARAIKAAASSKIPGIMNLLFGFFQIAIICKLLEIFI